MDDLEQTALAIIKIIDDLPEHAKSNTFYQKLKQLCPHDLFSLVMPQPNNEKFI